MPRKEGMERKDLLKANVAIFKTQGAALDKYAKKTVKVLWGYIIFRYLVENLWLNKPVAADEHRKWKCLSRKSLSRVKTMFLCWTSHSMLLQKLKCGEELQVSKGSKCVLLNLHFVLWLILKCLIQWGLVGWTRVLCFQKSFILQQNIFYVHARILFTKGRRIFVF